MKNLIYPTQISLSEMPHEGREYHYTRAGGELNETLEDLIGDKAYSVNIRLRPMGNVYEISGEIETTQDFLCSRCGRDSSRPLKDVFAELIVKDIDRSQKGHSSHVSHEAESSGPFCNYVSSDLFDIAEFVHEHIAASEPYLSLCERPDCEDRLKELQQKESASPQKESPFAILKKLKPQ